MIDERGKLPAEGAGVLLVQVDLILRAAEGEPHRLIGRSPVEIILQGDGYLRGSHPATRAYAERRTAEGKSKAEIIRCLKRYVARQVYPHLRPGAG
jgi:hypothetical protein